MELVENLSDFCEVNEVFDKCVGLGGGDRSWETGTCSVVDALSEANVLMLDKGFREFLDSLGIGVEVKDILFIFMRTLIYIINIWRTIIYTNIQNLDICQNPSI